MSKIRTDFVTNSSSSSFIVISKVNKCKELMDYMREEYGKYGERLMNEYLSPGVVEKDKYGYAEFCGKELPCDFGKELDPESWYISAEYYTWSSDGDQNGEDAWLRDHIPDEYMEDVYESEPD